MTESRRDRFIRLLKSKSDLDIIEFTHDAVRALIEVLEEPERTGRWIYGENDVALCDGYWCDKCGFFVPWDYQHKGIDFIKDYHYCPSCKAKMLTYTGAKMEVEHE